MPDNYGNPQLFGKAKHKRHNVLHQQRIAVRKNDGFEQFSAQQCTAGVPGAFTVHITHALPASVVHFVDRVCMSGAKHTAHKHWVCIKYTALLMYTVSVRTGALCTDILHCTCTVHRYVHLVH